MPAAAAAVWALVAMTADLGRPGDASVPNEAWALIVGFWAWLFIYHSLPRPLRSYVIAHELTHALWAWVLGAEVHGIRIRRDSGAVLLSHSNFLITLAPYFFPLYTVLVILLHFALALFFDMARYELWWLGIVGFSWGFHFTFTLGTMLQRQPDLQECGRVFSCVFILLMNVLGIALWLIAVTDATARDFAQLFMDRLPRIVHGAAWAMNPVVEAIRAFRQQ